MPLTRHFYVLDEVHAAVHYCGSRAAWKETVFWCRELALSGYASEAISALFESWLWHRGPFHMRWFLDAMTRLGGDTVSLDDLLVMAETLSRCSIKDHSLWTLFVSATEEAESLFDRVTPRSPVIGFPSEDPLEIFLIRAIYQHKAGSAWWAALQLEVERVWVLLGWYAEHVIREEKGWEMLRAYDQLLGYGSETYGRALCGVALLYMCLTVDQRSQSMASLPPVQQAFVVEWDCLMGRKGGRLYTIPYHGLYGITLRGRMRQQETTVRELDDVQKGMTCVCWEEINDMESCFPDDLPDEWTAEEKARSHGAGVLGKEEQISLWGWMRRYMTGTTRLLWGRGVRLARRDSVRLTLERVSLGDSPFLAMLSLPCTLSSEQTVKKPLTPVHKRKVIGY